VALIERIMNIIRSFAPESASLRLTTGAVSTDARLAGGLCQAALHEVFAAAPADSAAAAGFAVLLALRASPSRPVFWIRDDRTIRETGRLDAGGLIDLGADPDAITLVHSRDTRGVLQAAADSVKCAGVGTVVIEPWGQAPEFDLTASRRIAFAAARSGVLTLVLRTAADPVPSAAATRWAVAAAPSRALAANAPGNPVFVISLLRHRGGITGFDARVEWDRDRRSFRDAPLSRGVSPLFVSGAGDARERRAA
jgi:protein ImuA